MSQCRTCPQAQLCPQDPASREGCQRVASWLYFLEQDISGNIPLDQQFSS